MLNGSQCQHNHRPCACRCCLSFSLFLFTQRRKSDGLAQLSDPFIRQLLHHVGYVLFLTLLGLWSFMINHGFWLGLSIAITFLAQWHPLINPSNASLRPGHVTWVRTAYGVFQRDMRMVYHWGDAHKISWALSFDLKHWYFGSRT